MASPQSLYARLARRSIVAMLRWRARRGLAGVMAEGLEHLRPWSSGGDASGPLVIVANHSSWWDAVLPVLLSLDLLALDAVGLMDSTQLKRYPFFKRVGLLPVDRSNPRRALISLDGVAGHLAGRARVLWLFPQGRLLPAEQRPLGCEPGAAWLIEKLGGCAVASVAFRYEPCADPRPRAYLSIAPPQWIAGGEGLRATTRRIENDLTRQLDAVRGRIAAGEIGEYRQLLP